MCQLGLSLKIRRQGRKLFGAEAHQPSTNEPDPFFELRVGRGEYVGTVDEQIRFGAFDPSYPRNRILARGLKKLLEDRSEFDAAGDIDPPKLRIELFT